MLDCVSGVMVQWLVLLAEIKTVYGLNPGWVFIVILIYHYIPNSFFMRLSNQVIYHIQQTFPPSKHAYTPSPFIFIPFFLQTPIHSAVTLTVQSESACISITLHSSLSINQADTSKGPKRNICSCCAWSALCLTELTVCLSQGVNASLKMEILI